MLAFYRKIAVNNTILAHPLKGVCGGQPAAVARAGGCADAVGSGALPAPGTIAMSSFASSVTIATRRIPQRCGCRPGEWGPEPVPETGLPLVFCS
jgi:hypothetical protein